MRGVRLCDEEHTAGETVEAMHDAGAEVAADSGERTETVEKGVHDGSGMHSGARVHHHAGGLVDGDNAFVLIKAGERDVLGGGFERRLGRGFDDDFFRAAKEGGRFDCGVVDAHAGLANPALQAGAAVLREFFVEEKVETFAAIGGFSFDQHLCLTVHNACPSGGLCTPGHCGLRIKPAPVAELKTAEGTVVERKSEQAKNTPERIPRAAVDLVPPAEYRQPAAVADGTLTPALKQGEERAIKMGAGPALHAAERGAGQDSEEQSPRAALSFTAAFLTHPHRRF